MISLSLGRLTREEVQTLIEESDKLSTAPPTGCYKVVNLYVKKENGEYKLIVEHEDTPIG